MQARLDRHGSGDGAVPSLTVQLTELRPAVLLLRAAGDLRAATAPKLRDLAGRELRKRPRALVIDLSDLSVMDVEAVPALVDLAHQAGEADIGLYLISADGIVPPALDAAGERHLFDLYRDVDSALQALPGVLP